MRREGVKLRAAGARRQDFERLIYPVFGTGAIADIRRSEIVRLLERSWFGSDRGGVSWLDGAQRYPGPRRDPVSLLQDPWQWA
jgi:hypothetical protein